MAEAPSTIVLADDHAVVRAGLRMLLERDGTMQVVACAVLTVGFVYEWRKGALEWD